MTTFQNWIDDNAITGWWVGGGRRLEALVALELMLNWGKRDRLSETSGCLSMQMRLVMQNCSTGVRCEQKRSDSGARNSLQ